MVFLAAILCSKLRENPRRFRGFIDRLRISVKGGSGGAGLPKYGGTGGAGGNVYFVCKEGLSLNVVEKAVRANKVRAAPGDDSSSKGIIGMPGKDLYVHVPPGITAYDESGIVIGELNEDSKKLLIAKGGIGGCKETAYLGQKGQARNVIVDLKLIADVGLVGFPNAGKSTFLSAISKARPKIANYPFTTLKPQLGIIEYEDHRQISIADLPGLIEGAHANYGMGHKFLKHLERTKILLYIIDIQGFQLSLKHVHRDCMETILLLNKEIELYKPDLLDMPAIVLLNKMDTVNARSIYEKIQSNLTDLSKYAAQCPPKFRPEKVIQFEKILTTSLIKCDKCEVDMIKTTIRELIDKIEEDNLLKSGDPIASLEKEFKSFKEKYALTLT